MKSRVNILSFVIGMLIATNSFALNDSQGVNCVSNPVRTDGFGAQFQTIIYAVIYAEYNNLKYVYTPFSSMEHNYNHGFSFLRNKEKLINFAYNYPSSTGCTSVKVLAPHELITFFEADIDTYSRSSSIVQIKAIFRQNKPQNIFNNDKFNIAVHIRRPNKHDSRLKGADIPDQEFINIVAALKSKYKDKDYLVHIYSQGRAVDFEKFADARTILHLNESIEDTFTGLVFADVLVISPSSFSYTAGLLSDGEVYYIPFWHPPLPGWHKVS